MWSPPSSSYSRFLESGAIYRRKFRSQTLTIWTDEKQRWEEPEKRKEERRSKKRKSQKKEDPGARKGRKVAKHCVFPMICGPGGSRSRLAKAAGAEPCGQMRDEKLQAVCGAKHISKSKCTKHLSFGTLLEVAMSKKCTPLWREARLQVKKLKALHIRSTFGSCNVEKVHAVVARSTCRSQNVKSTPCLDHFGTYVEKCTPLWREADFQVKMHKASQCWTTFGRSDVVSRGRRKGLGTWSKVSKT